MNPAAKLLEEAKRHGITLTPTADGLHLKAETEPRPEFLEHLKRNRDRLRYELTRACREAGEELEIGATWCRACWQYKPRPCVATDKQITGGQDGAWTIGEPLEEAA